MKLRKSSGNGEINISDLGKAYTLTAILSAGFNIDPVSNSELMEKAMKHANAVMSSSVLKSFLFVFIPERIRYYFNMTIYPSESDRFFRGLAGKIIEEAKNRQPGTRSDFVSLMSENIIPASEEETAAKGFSETEIV